MSRRVYHYGNGTFFEQIKLYGEIRDPLTLCRCDTVHDGSVMNWLHTDKLKVTCPKCRELLARETSEYIG